MSYAEIKRSESLAHKYVFRVTAIDGSTARVLWEGDSLGDGEVFAERTANEARARGSQETIVLDGFRLDIEKLWTARLLTSRPPSVLKFKRSDGNRGRPRILFIPLEFPTWNNGGRSWSYSASLAYEAGLRAAGCEVTTINTACVPYHGQILRGRRFDQVWFHCHPRHISDFSFRQWIGEIAPVRLMLCGETVFYSPEDCAVNPWFTSHTRTFEQWVPHITHAAFVDPSDADRSPLRRSMWWQQAIPRRFILPVNERPSTVGVFVGSLYEPRDRWLWNLGELIEKIESPESDVFRWFFEHSHEWIQHAFARVQGRDPWWAKYAHRAYNRFQVGLRRNAFRNFLATIREGLAVVNLPSQCRGYSGRVLEGMAAGRPVVTHRVSGYPPPFEDLREILLYDTVEQLADHLRRLQAQPAAAIAIASRAREALLRSHTVEQRTAELLRFAEDV